MPYDPVARRRNLRHRHVDADGHVVSTIIPSHLHGRPSGYILYGCLCPSCKGWARNYKAELAERRAFNQRIIDQIMCASGQEVQKTDHPQLSVVADTPVEPAPEPERAVVPLPRQQPVKITPFPLTSGVRERISDVATVEAISRAYHRPEWVAVLEDDRERRVHGNMEIIVGTNANKPVLFFREREEVGTGDAELLKPAKKAVPKAKGGRGGSQGPSDYSGLIERLKAAGCTVERTGSGHIKVGRNGRSVTLPATASDWRALKNSIAQARREGLLA